VTRRVTNVSGAALTVTPSLTGLVGIAAAVSPASLTLANGASASYSVTFTNATAAPGAYLGGQLTWNGGGYSVRSPIVVRPVALSAPVQVSGSYNVTFGYNGLFTATARGLIPAVLTPGVVADDRPVPRRVDVDVEACDRSDESLQERPTRLDRLDVLGASATPGGVDDPLAGRQAVEEEALPGLGRRAHSRRRLGRRHRSQRLKVRVDGPVAAQCGKTEDHGRNSSQLHVGPPSARQ